MIIRKAIQDHFPVIIALLFCSTESFFGVVDGTAVVDHPGDAPGHSPSVTHVRPNQKVTPVRIELNDKFTWESIRGLFSDHKLSFKLDDNDEGSSWDALAVGKKNGIVAEEEECTNPTASTTNDNDTPATATATQETSVYYGVIPTEQEACLAHLVDSGKFRGVKHVTLYPDDPEKTFVAYSMHGWQSLTSNLTNCLEGLNVLYPTNHTEVAWLHCNQDYSPVPRVVVHVQSTEDVVRAVQCARAANSTILTRGGGHSGRAYSLQTGNVVVINTEALNDLVPLDKDVTEFRVGPGARMGKVYYRLSHYHRYLPMGFEMGPSIGGQILGGGLGPLSHKHGLGIDHLRAATLVDINGRIKHANETHNADLFWALRGAGHNQFGVVTDLHFSSIPMENVTAFQFRFEYQLPSPTKQGEGDGAHDYAVFRDLWRTVERFIRSRHVLANLVVEQVKLDDWWIGIKGTFDSKVDSVDDALKMLGLEHLKPIQLQGDLQFMSWVEASALWSGVAEPKDLELLAAFTKHKMWHSHGGFAIETSTPETVIDGVAAALGMPTPDVPSAHVYFVLLGHGGAATDVEPSAMAFPHRHVGLQFCFGTFWENQNDREAVYSWHYQALPAMEELRAAGGYINHVDTVVPQDFKDRPHVHNYRENSDRLVHIKSLYDPSGSLKFPDSLPTGPVCSLGDASTSKE